MLPRMEAPPSFRRGGALPAAAALLFIIAISAPSHAAVVPTHFEDTQLIGGLNQPTDFARLPDGRVLVTEQKSGIVRLFVNPTTSAIALTVPSLNASGNERGLLAITLDFDWPSSPYVYLYYNRTGSKLRLVRYTASGDLTNGSSTNLALGTSLLLLDDLLDNASNHNGGALRFGTDGCLYLSLGDDADRCAAQDSTTLKGAILRMWVNGLGPAGGGPVTRAALTPTDNPLVTTNANAKLVYAYGLRNPFRFHIDPETGLVTIHGRLDSQVSVGGLKVDLMEVEHTIAGLPGVGAAVVVYDGGIEAFVAASDPAALDQVETAVEAALTERLAPYKRPKVIHVVEQLPRTATGKLVRDRNVLRAASTKSPS